MLSYATASTVVNWTGYCPSFFFALSRSLFVDDYFDDNVIRKWSVNDIMKAAAAFNDDEEKNNPFVFSTALSYSWYRFSHWKMYPFGKLFHMEPIFFSPIKNSRFSTSELAVIRKINLPNFPDFRLLNLWLESNDKQKRNKSISHNWQLHYFGTRKSRANKNWSYSIFESENLL